MWGGSMWDILDCLATLRLSPSFLSSTPAIAWATLDGVTPTRRVISAIDNSNFSTPRFAIVDRLGEGAYFLQCPTPESTRLKVGGVMG